MITLSLIILLILIWAGTLVLKLSRSQDDAYWDGYKDGFEDGIKTTREIFKRTHHDTN